MDRNEKFIDRLTDSERARLAEALERLQGGAVDGLNLKRLRDHKNLVRLRVGRIRVVCRIGSGKIIIVRIGFRNEDTYKF